MSEKKGAFKSTEEPDLENRAMTQTHNALAAVLEAISGLNGKIDSMAVEQAKQKAEIESIKNTPFRLPPTPLNPLGPIINGDGDEDYSDMPNLESDAPPSRRSTDRRNSFMASNTLAEEVRMSSTAGAHDAGVTLLHVQKTVPAHLQVDIVSIPKLVEAKENQQIFINEHQQRKTLVHFFTTAALNHMIKSEETLSTPLAQFLTLATVYTLQDEVIENIVARLVRSKYCVTRNKLVKTIMGMAPQLQAYGSTWSFSIVG